MNVGLIYALTSSVCLIQLLLISNRSKATDFKETIDVNFCKMVHFFVAFCVFDILWGVCFSRVFFVSQVFFYIVAYGYHTMAAISAYIWLNYAVYYIKASDNEKSFFAIFQRVLLIIQLITLNSNVFFDTCFIIDKECNYTTGSFRLLLYCLQFTYYIVLMLYGIIKWHLDRENAHMYKEIILISAIPLMFGIGQYYFYDVSMYAFGFTVSAFIIYSFSVTSVRENFMTARARKFSDDANTDALSELYNRRAYEDDLNSMPAIPLEDDFAYISMDLNGLKIVNDTLGHEAGDELIMGAAFCMLTCIGPYGKLYRIGGDEFVGMIHAEKEKIDEILEELDGILKKWKGKLVKEISVSYGYVTKKEFPAISVNEMSKIADRRMYESKSAYYASKGVDRRGQQEAYTAICSSYTKILKINLTDDSYSIIQMNNWEKDSLKGFNERISKWLHNFAKSGQVHEDDLADYLVATDLQYLRNYFASGKDYFCIYYRRIIGSEFRKAMMEIIPAKDYSLEKQSVFLYVKNIGV